MLMDMAREREVTDRIERMGVGMCEGSGVTPIGLQFRVYFLVVSIFVLSYSGFMINVAGLVYILNFSIVITPCLSKCTSPVCRIFSYSL